MFNKTLLFCLFFIFSFGSFSQEKEGRRMVEILCSDSLAGRGYIDNGVNKAAQFLVKEFKSINLHPFFGDTSYTQSFSFDVNTFPTNMLFMEGNDTLRPGIDYLVNENSGSYKGELRPIKADTSIITHMDQLKQLIKKMQLLNKNCILFNLTGVDVHKTYKLIYQLNPLANFATVIYLTDQKFTWSVGRHQYRHPAILLKTKKYKPFSPLYINIQAKYISSFSCKNIAGYIPSKKENSDTIVFTAHYDHLGEMGTVPTTTIFPGGNDNASGTAMLLSMAQYFQQHPSKHTLLFIAFSGEEAGLLGSHYFVNSKVMDLSSIRFLINLDIMGSGEEGITAVNGSIFIKPFDLLQSINQKHHYLSQVKKRGETANSDHYFFYKEGVPCFFIYTMGPNKNYHDVYDTYDNLTFAAYNDIVHLLVDFVKEL